MLSLLLTSFQICSPSCFVLCTYLLSVVLLQAHQEVLWHAVKAWNLRCSDQTGVQQEDKRFVVHWFPYLFHSFCDTFVFLGIFFSATDPCICSTTGFRMLLITNEFVVEK